MTSVSKNVCIDKIDDTVNQYNNAYHSTIKWKPIDVKLIIHIDFIKNNDKNNQEDLKFEVGDHVRISKYKIILHKVLLEIGLKKFL